MGLSDHKTIRRGVVGRNGSPGPQAGIRSVLGCVGNREKYSYRKSHPDKWELICEQIERDSMAIDVRNSKIGGKGIFTTDVIPKHSVILKVKFLREITEDKPLGPEKGELFEHCHWLPDGKQMLVSEPDCYTNNSCSPNAFCYSVNRQYYLPAMRDIQKEEEITLCYDMLVVDGESWECKCGSSNCRGFHKFDFFLLPREEQLIYLPYLDPWFAEVHADKIDRLLKNSLNENT